MVRVRMLGLGLVVLVDSCSTTATICSIVVKSLNPVDATVGLPS